MNGEAITTLLFCAGIPLVLAVLFARLQYSGSSGGGGRVEPVATAKWDEYNDYGGGYYEPATTSSWANDGRQHALTMNYRDGSAMPRPSEMMDTGRGNRNNSAYIRQETREEAYHTTGIDTRSIPVPSVTVVNVDDQPAQKSSGPRYSSGNPWGIELEMPRDK